MPSTSFVGSVVFLCTTTIETKAQVPYCGVNMSCWLPECGCGFHSVKPKPETLFNDESSLFLSQSLHCLLSHAHTLTVVLHYYYIRQLFSDDHEVYIPHGHLRIAVFNLCYTTTFNSLTTNMFTFNWPFAHTHYQTHMLLYLYTFILYYVCECL